MQKVMRMCFPHAYQKWVVFGWLLAGIAYADESPSSSSFGSSASVGRQLSNDAQMGVAALSIHAIEQYNAWRNALRENLKNEFGLNVASDYNALFQGASESPGKDFAAGGVFRIYGQWALPSKGKDPDGTLVFKVENRHRYSNIPPQNLGGEIGSSSLTGITWSDAGWQLSNLYWHQQLFNNRAGFVAGFVDVTDYVDTYGLVNPWTDFINSSFGTSPTIAAPGQCLGFAARGSVTSNLYISAGLADANGKATDPTKSFDTLFSDQETFKHVEFGWHGPWDRRMQDNLHLTLWQVDARSNSDIPRGRGGAMSASWLYNEQWLPFFRAGWSDGGGGVPQKAAASTGVGYYMRNRADLLALACGWGHPSDNTFGSNPQDEYTVEFLYRMHLVRHLSITPDIQFLIHPANNPNDDFIALFGLRCRLVF